MPEVVEDAVVSEASPVKVDKLNGSAKTDGEELKENGTKTENGHSNVSKDVTATVDSMEVEDNVNSESNKVNSPLTDNSNDNSTNHSEMAQDAKKEKVVKDDKCDVSGEVDSNAVAKTEDSCESNKADSSRGSTETANVVQESQPVQHPDTDNNGTKNQVDLTENKEKPQQSPNKKIVETHDSDSQSKVTQSDKKQEVSLNHDQKSDLELSAKTSGALIETDKVVQTGETKEPGAPILEAKQDPSEESHEMDIDTNHSLTVPHTEKDGSNITLKPKEAEKPNTTEESKEADEKKTQESKEADEKKTQESKEVDEKKTQESKEADEKKNQESKEADEKKTQESNESDEKKTQKSSEPDEKKTQESNKPDEKKTQESNKPDEKKTQESKEHDEKKTQESKEPDEKKTQESKEPDEKKTQESKVVDESNKNKKSTDELKASKDCNLSQQSDDTKDLKDEAQVSDKAPTAGNGTQETNKNEKVPCDSLEGNSKTCDTKVPEELDSMITEGRACMAKNNFNAAADLLGQACEKLRELFGELDQRCADCYYYYGSAMLECAKTENSVLGEGVNKEESESEEEEIPMVKEKEDDADETKEDKEEMEEDSKPDDEPMETDAEEKSPDEANEEKSPVEANEENGEITLNKEDEEEEDTTLKAAWETLELAKFIFEKQNNVKMLADTYMKLGEVAVESGHKTGFDDMKKSLELRKTFYGHNHRAIPETHFNIGLSYSLFELFDEAIQEFETSKKLLESRIEMLQKSEGTDSNNEINEIKSLLPDIDEKIKDMKESKVEKAKAENTITNKEQVGSSGAAAGAGATIEKAKTVSNLTHLIKRKRKIEEVAEPTNDKQPKQPCVESKDESSL